MLQPELARCGAAELWRMLQPEHARCRAAEQLAAIDLWRMLTYLKGLLPPMPPMVQQPQSNIAGNGTGVTWGDSASGGAGRPGTAS